jgi:hypothetical protein
MSCTLNNHVCCATVTLTLHSVMKPISVCVHVIIVYAPGLLLFNTLYIEKLLYQRPCSFVFRGLCYSFEFPRITNHSTDRK